MHANLDKEMATLESELTLLLGDLRQGDFSNPHASPAQMLKRLGGVGEKVEQLSAQTSTFSEWQKELGLTIPPNTGL